MTRWGRNQAPRLGGALAACVTMLVACGGGELDDLEAIASRACDDFADAGTPIERRVVEEDLIAEVEAVEDVELVDVLVEMAEGCPEVATGLLGGEQNEALADIELELEQCSDDGAEGTVRNVGSRKVDVRIRVRFTDANEVLLDSSTTIVDDLRSNETGNWSVRFLGDGDVDHCNARVDNVT